MKRRYYALVGGVSLFCLAFFAGGYYLYLHPMIGKASYKTPEEDSVYVRFGLEAYDSIVKNYWMQAKEDDLAHLFALSLQKATNASSTPILQTAGRAGVARMFSDSLKTATSTEAKKQLARDTLTVLLYNLQPIGRNALYSEAQEAELRQTVSNVSPSSDLYENLGLQKGASTEEVVKAYTEKEEELKEATSTEAKQELAEAAHAKEVLADESARALYDEAKIEPTVWSREMGSTLYLSIGKISPTTLQEFGRIVEKATATPKLDSLIIDLRGNIGGALDFPQYFLGLFVGKNQFAFDLFHQGEYEAQRTVTPKWDELSRYKEIAFFIDSMTQPTAELTVAIFKRRRRGADPRLGEC